jgi:hypothetical protein
MVKLFSIFFCFVCINESTYGQAKQKEGLVNFINGVDPEGFRRFTWFKDSVVIFEIFESYSESLNDSIVDQGSRLRNYSILDLTTRQGQDYLSFSDTAKPLTNYLLQEDEGIFRKNHPYDKYVDSLMPMSDTIIDENPLKRLWFSLSGDGWHFKIIYFLLCSKPENIFHLSKAVDNRYPGCKVIDILYEDLDSGRNLFNKIVFIRNKLTEEEEKIFKKWKANLYASTLPVTTKLEADKYLSNFKSASSKTYFR